MRRPGLPAFSVALLVAGCSPRVDPSGPVHPQTGGPQASGGANGHAAAPGEPPARANVDGGAGAGPTTPPVVAPPELSPTVKVMLRISPLRVGKKKIKANVYWGKKLLGETPFDWERPRGSGPVDLVVRADGFFPVHA